MMSTPETAVPPVEDPVIIQGGMGVAVSSWHLAREVSRAGHLGVVSGTALDAVLARTLQDGDPGAVDQAEPPGHDGDHVRPADVDRTDAEHHDGGDRQQDGQRDGDREGGPPPRSGPHPGWGVRIPHQGGHVQAGSFPSWSARRVAPSIRPMSEACR